MQPYTDLNKTRVRLTDSVITIDIDGTIADLHTEWLRRYNEDWNDTLTPEDITSFRIEDYVKPECGVAIMKYLKDKDLYDNVLPIKGALEAIEFLRKELRARVVFNSSCVPGAADVKLGWLIKHGFLTNNKLFVDDFIVAGDKSLIHAACLIDDYERNLTKFKGISILFDAPWNKRVSPTLKNVYNLTINRLESWDINKLENLLTYKDIPL